MSLPRRSMLTAAGSTLLGLALAGCDSLNRSAGVKATLAQAE